MQKFIQKVLTYYGNIKASRKPIFSIQYHLPIFRGQVFMICCVTGTPFLNTKLDKFNKRVSCKIQVTQGRSDSPTLPFVQKALLIHLSVYKLTLVTQKSSLFFIRRAATLSNGTMLSSRRTHTFTLLSFALKPQYLHTHIYILPLFYSTALPCLNQRYFFLLIRLSYTFFRGTELFFH